MNYPVQIGQMHFALPPLIDFYVMAIQGLDHVLADESFVPSH